MANEQNLLKMDELTPSQRRANASKAGKASVKAKRERKALKESLTAALESAMSGDVTEKLGDIDFLDALNSDGLSVQDKIAVSMIAQALNGSVQAAQFIRDTIGEKPVEKVEIDSGVAEASKAIDEHIKALKNDQKQ